MAQILDAHSQLTSKAELDLFTVPPTQVTIDNGEYYEIYPKNTVTNDGPFEFQITRDPLYLDLNRNYLHMVLKLTKADGSDLEPLPADQGMNGVPINLFGKTFFKQVKVWMNNKLAYDSSDTYAYRSYLETELNYGADAKNTHMQAAMYYRDQAGEMDTWSNSGHKTRGELVRGSKTFEVMAPIHSDIFNQDRLMLSNMDIRLELHRNSDKFVLMSFQDAATTANVKVSIQSMMWFVRKVQILPSEALAIEQRLIRNVAQYPLRRVVVKTLHIAGGRRDTPVNTLFMGQIPRRIVLGCVEKDAYFGSMSKNPFNFQPFGIRQVQVLAGGKIYPRNPMVINFETNQYTRAYLSLFEALNMGNEDRSNTISYTDYAKGYTLFGFDLTPNSSDGANWGLVADGTTSVKVEFNKDTPAAGLKMVVLAEFDGLLSIDRNRNVHFDYTI
jgi:hypothetical protein